MPKLDLNIPKYGQAIENVEPVRIIGKVLQVVGLVIEAQMQGEM